MKKAFPNSSFQRASRASYGRPIFWIGMGGCIVFVSLLIWWFLHLAHVHILLQVLWFLVVPVLFRGMYKVDQRLKSDSELCLKAQDLDLIVDENYIYCPCDIFHGKNEARLEVVRIPWVSICSFRQLRYNGYGNAWNANAYFVFETTDAGQPKFMIENYLTQALEQEFCEFANRKLSENLNPGMAK